MNLFCYRDLIGYWLLSTLNSESQNLFCQSVDVIVLFNFLWLMNESNFFWISLSSIASILFLSYSFGKEASSYYYYFLVQRHMVDKKLSVIDNVVFDFFLDNRRWWLCCYWFDLARGLCISSREEVCFKNKMSQNEGICCIFVCAHVSAFHQLLLGYIIMFLLFQGYCGEGREKWHP